MQQSALSPSTTQNRSFQFEAFTFMPERALLLRDGEAVRVGSRALDILACLVEQPGTLVDKQVLSRRVWPNTLVEEVSLRVHLMALRRALGDGVDGARYIVNAPGRGYRFVALVQAAEAAPARAVAPSPRQPISTTPPLIGRGEDVRKLKQALALSTLVTLTGGPGVGKSAVAMLLMEERQEEGSRTAILDIGACPDTATLARHISDLQPLWEQPNTLLLLDNCEHLTEAVSAAARVLLAASPGLRILATSREPLRAAGEVVRKLNGLNDPRAANDADEAPRPTAVAAFETMARAHAAEFRVTPENTDAISQLCQRLDGNPAALELAAAQTPWLSVHDLAARLDPQFALSICVPQGFGARFPSLCASYDWSWATLSDPARRLLRGLDRIGEAFDFDDLAAIDLGAPSPNLVHQALSELVMKSLVLADVRSTSTKYRIPHLLRAYVRRKQNLSA